MRDLPWQPSHLHAHVTEARSPDQLHHVAYLVFGEADGLHEAACGVLDAEAEEQEPAGSFVGQNH